MTKIRNFIRLPHHALSAMLDFGMEFETMYQGEMHEADKTMLLNDIDDNGNIQESPYYIKQSSDHLLNTKLHDVASFYWGARGRRMYGTIIDLEPLTLAVSGVNWRGEMPDFRIDKRDELSFPLIETEVTE